MVEQNQNNTETKQDEYLPDHYESKVQHLESTKLGMWLFLATEIMLFGGLFVAYTIYRANHPEIFIFAGKFLNVQLGGLNTIVLICSSLTMAWAVRCAQLSQRKGLMITLALTLLFAFMFLSIKYVEYNDKWKHGLLWGERYKPTHQQAETHKKPLIITSLDVSHFEQVQSETEDIQVQQDPNAPFPQAAESPPGLADNAFSKIDKTDIEIEPKNVHLFFSIYFMMTGLHAFHIILGIFAIGWLLLRTSQGVFHSRNFIPVDMIGLYWHLVDLIWIFLFPLLYLID